MGRSESIQPETGLAGFFFEKLGPGAHRNMSDMAEEIHDMQEKAQNLQDRLEGAARSMGHAPYVVQLGQRRLMLWQGIKKLLKGMGPHG